jgi:hypothetical protein
MRALRHLRELVRVAEEDHVSRGRADCERVGERELTVFVDEERVHLHVVAREEERRAGDQLQLRIDQIVVVGRAVDAAAPTA